MAPIAVPTLAPVDKDEDFEEWDGLLFEDVAVSEFVAAEEDVVEEGLFGLFVDREGDPLVVVIESVEFDVRG